MDISYACENRIYAYDLDSAGYLLGGADGAGAHADSQGICTSFYEAPGLRPSDHIACYDLQSWMGFLQVLQHLYLVCRITCCQQQMFASLVKTRGREGAQCRHMGSNKWYLNLSTIVQLLSRQTYFEGHGRGGYCLGAPYRLQLSLQRAPARQVWQLRTRSLRCLGTGGKRT